MTTSYEHARTLLSLGRAEEALETLADAPEVDEPEWWRAHASALLVLDRYEDAARSALEGLECAPEHPYLLDALAAARLGLEDLAGAEEAILAALRVDAEDPDLLTRYAHVVATARQLDKAEKLVVRALAIDPENTFALHMHALIATARDDPREAIARSRELLRHVPESAFGHAILGAVHSQEGDVDDAADHLRRAVVLDPYDDDVADAARKARVASHWLLWPLRPLNKFGAAPVWIAAVALIYSLRAMKMRTAAGVLGLVWLTYCVYSWVVPPLVRRLTRRT